MIIETKKTRLKARLETIDKAFLDLKANINNQAAIVQIEKELTNMYNQSFTIRILKTKNTDPVCLMSVFPEISTVNKIIQSIVNESPSSIIAEVWSKNKSWIVEIDRRMIDNFLAPFSARECTAVLLHEIGHTVYSNSIPQRIARVMKYEFANLSTKFKLILKNDKFSSMMSLPIIDSCTTSSNIKEEYKADKYAKNLGYGPELYSVLNKISKPSIMTPEKNMEEVFKFSTEMISNFEKRQGKLNQNLLDKLILTTPSEYIKEYLKSTRAFYTEKSNQSDFYISDEIRMNYFTEKIHDIEDNYYTEFFIFKKKLKPLDPYAIDYIQVQIDDIKNNDDKLLILSYIRNKLDTAQYYIDILQNDKYSGKYDVPHSMNYLIQYRSKLQQLLTMCMQRKIRSDDRLRLVIDSYPPGYEG